jgi:hypothetical protein
MVSSGRTMNWVGYGRIRLWPSSKFKPFYGRTVGKHEKHRDDPHTNHSTVAISSAENIYIINVLCQHVQQRNTCSNQLVSSNGEVCVLMMVTVYFNKHLIRTGDLHRSGSCARQTNGSFRCVRHQLASSHENNR